MLPIELFHQTERPAVQFRVQPIVFVDDPTRLAALEVLARNAASLKFSDFRGMLHVDMAAAAFGAELSAKVHCFVSINVEWTTVAIGFSVYRDYIRPGMIIELVERTKIIRYGECFHEIVEQKIHNLRNAGAIIAVDDFIPNKYSHTSALIDIISPDIIKVDKLEYIPSARRIAPQAKIVIERAEDPSILQKAAQLGAHWAQGYWCDPLAKIDASVVCPEYIQYVQALATR